MRSRPRLASFGVLSAQVVAWVCAAAAGAVLLSSCGSCDSIVRQTALPSIATHSFDAIAADQSGRRLFLADGTAHGVDVIDVSGPSPRLVGTVALPAAPNGLAFAPDKQRLYAGMDGGKVAVVDTGASAPHDMPVIATVTVDPKTADLVDYSPQTENVYVGTASSNTVVVVDTASNKVLQTFDLKSAVEQPRYDPADGKLYVAVPGDDAIVQLDPASGAVTRKYYQKNCRPTGLAINPTRQIALAACRSSTIVFNLSTGLNEISRAVPGGDLVNYDPTVDRFTVGSAHGLHDSAVGVLYGNAKPMGVVQASQNAHGAVFDDSTGAVYAVSASGLLSFTPAACAPPPDWLSFAGGLTFYVLPLAGFGLFLAWYARRRSRPDDPNARRRRTWEELQAEDVAAERERIRDLEDAIYGPEDG